MEEILTVFQKEVDSEVCPCGEFVGGGGGKARGTYASQHNCSVFVVGGGVVVSVFGCFVAVFL